MPGRRREQSRRGRADLILEDPNNVGKVNACSSKVVATQAGCRRILASIGFNGSSSPTHRATQVTKVT